MRKQSARESGDCTGSRDEAVGRDIGDDRENKPPLDSPARRHQRVTPPPPPPPLLDPISSLSILYRLTIPPINPPQCQPSVPLFASPRTTPPTAAASMDAPKLTSHEATASPTAAQSAASSTASPPDSPSPRPTSSPSSPAAGPAKARSPPPAMKRTASRSTLAQSLATRWAPPSP